MHCPFCKSDLEIEKTCYQASNEVINGTIRCKCNRYPVLEGIVNLAPYPSSVLRFLDEKKIEKAISVMLTPHPYNKIHTTCDYLQGAFGRLCTCILLVMMYQNLKRLYKKEASLYELLRERNFKYRFSEESLWSVYPFIQLLKKHNRRILSLGCGAGHEAFIISKYIDPKELICVDMDFRLLYLAKKFMAQKAQFICIDANHPLPFNDKSFTTILSLDVMNWIKGRASLATEMERVLDLKGMLLVLHLHNSLVHYHLPWSFPLPPDQWMKLFQDLEIKAIPETILVDDFILSNRLDLTKEYTSGELNTYESISLIGFKEKLPFGIYENVNIDLLNHKENLIINPIYKVKNEGDRKVLYARADSRHLPNKYVIESEIDKILQSRTSDFKTEVISSESLSQIESLMKKFILINVPLGYI
jgi:SAM-dependent methyltransferase